MHPTPACNRNELCGASAREGRSKTWRKKRGRYLGSHFWGTDFRPHFCVFIFSPFFASFFSDSVFVLGVGATPRFVHSGLAKIKVNEIATTQGPALKKLAKKRCFLGERRSEEFRDFFRFYTFFFMFIFCSQKLLYFPLKKWSVFVQSMSPANNSRFSGI